jgi:cellulose synthase/poly-beta-1,6-N-acetylglucosamine synthase-like glycosyltransferase
LINIYLKGNLIRCAINFKGELEMITDMEIFRSISTVIGTIIQMTLLVIFLYYLVISMFGWIKRKEKPASNYPPKNKFAIIISAHNEEAVIGCNVRCLKQLNYPEDMYDIYVIADNCADNTAEVAEEAGAIVNVRKDATKRGKGYSLEWMFKRLSDGKEKYDAICILDADNLVSNNFLLEMNKQLTLGHNVIQGYLDSKNPHDSWVSGNYSLSYWISNRLFQLPRYYLGLSCALGGTGFVMSTKVLNEIGWGATCLTEDLEFSLRLVLKGMKVSWCHEAVVYDEKPLKMGQSWKQRRRWMQGHSDCAGRYFKKMIVKAVKERNMVAFDCALYLIQPFFIAFNGLFVVFSVVKFLMFENLSIIFEPSYIGFFGLMLLLTYIYIVFVILEGKYTNKILLYFILYPIYSLTWVPIIIQGFIDRNKTEWAHTVHTRSIDIKDVEVLKKVG